MIKILFVCLGNICRSPLAEAIFAEKIRKKGLERVLSCDSAGTSNYHIGDDPDPRTIQVAERHQIPIHHKGQQFTKKLSEQYHYWVAMDHSNFRDMETVVGKGHERLLLMRDFDPRGRGLNVPDPYYGGADGFEHVYQLLDRALDEFMDFLMETHQLSNES